MDDDFEERHWDGDMIDDEVSSLYIIGIILLECTLSRRAAMKIWKTQNKYSQNVPKNFQHRTI